MSGVLGLTSGDFPNGSSRWATRRALNTLGTPAAVYVAADAATREAKQGGGAILEMELRAVEEAAEQRTAPRPEELPSDDETEAEGTLAPEIAGITQRLAKTEGGGSTRLPIEMARSNEDAIAMVPPSAAQSWENTAFSKTQQWGEGIRLEARTAYMLEGLYRPPRHRKREGYSGGATGATAGSLIPVITEHADQWGGGKRPSSWARCAR